MRLWILRPIDDIKGPWDPPYDKQFGLVIAAKSARRAREMATETSRDMGDAWSNPLLSTCEVLKPIEEQVIMIDHRGG